MRRLGRISSYASPAGSPDGDGRCRQPRLHSAPIRSTSQLPLLDPHQAGQPAIAVGIVRDGAATMSSDERNISAGARRSNKGYW